MKSKICLLLAMLCVVGLAAANTRAGDYANLKFIGFSSDGKYLAFTQYGTGDASGYPFAGVYLVDVEKNTFVAKPFKVSIENEKATEDAAIRKVEAMAARKMSQLKIERGNTGMLVLAHLMTDWTYQEWNSRGDDKEQKVKLNDYLNPNSPNNYEYYQLTLKPIPVKTGCNDYYTHYMMELSLDHFSQGEKDMEAQILQKDSALPESRGCPQGYRIERVYSYKGKIAVFINVFTQGWEGPDMRYMVVTGNWQRYF